MSFMTLFYLNKETLKISWWYIYKKHAMNGRSFMCGYGWVGFWSLLARHKNWLEPINCIFFNPCLLLMLLEFIKYLSHSLTLSLSLSLTLTLKFTHTHLPTLFWPLVAILPSLFEQPYLINIWSYGSIFYQFLADL